MGIGRRAGRFLTPSMLIDGPIEARGVRRRHASRAARLRRCSSTAPLKLRETDIELLEMAATPSMLIDGPIEARFRPGAQPRSRQDSVDAHRRPH